jgi:hypothetical protein
MCEAFVESLENRRLLSSNVTVTAGADFVVTITGDKKNNSIEVQLNADADGYLIRGTKGTKINGATELNVRSPVSVFLNVSMGKGNDSVNFLGTFNTQSVSIDTGDGDDRVRIAGVSHFGDLAINTGKGKDSVALDTVRVTQNLNVDLGKDKDAISFAEVQVEGNATVVGGGSKNTVSGADQLAVSGTTSISGVQSDKPKDKQGDDDGDGHDH